VARPIVMGVAGGSGSGKSTVVREVRRALPQGIVSVLAHDAYYRDLSDVPFEERVGVNFDHPDSLETSLMVRHVRALLEGASVEVPRYDFSAHVRRPTTRPLAPTPVLILDGILVLADPALRALMDLKVFVDTDADVRLLRRIRRDIARRGRNTRSVLRQYERSVRPMHLEFVEPSKRYADLLVPEGGHNRVAVDLVVTKLRRLMAREESVVRAPSSSR
jgi:uridine kinase